MQQELQQPTNDKKQWITPQMEIMQVESGGMPSAFENVAYSS